MENETSWYDHAEVARCQEEYVITGLWAVRIIACCIVLGSAAWGVTNLPLLVFAGLATCFALVGLGAAQKGLRLYRVAVARALRDMHNKKLDADAIATKFLEYKVRVPLRWEDAERHLRSLAGTFQLECSAQRRYLERGCKFSSAEVDSDPDSVALKAQTAFTQGSILHDKAVAEAKVAFWSYWNFVADNGHRDKLVNKIGHYMEPNAD